MNYIYQRLILLLFCIVCAQSIKASKAGQHLSVVMRMIGHQVLLSAGDSTSRVLAIEQDADKYKINFESEFAFDPEDLIPSVRCIMEDANITNGYIVEVIDNKADLIVYNFEISSSGFPDMLPCTGRPQSRSNYTIQVTMMNQTPAPALEPNYARLPIMLASSLFALIGLLFYSKKKKTSLTNSPSDPNLIPIGNSIFDKRNRQLLIDHHNIDLTHKEAELLLLLQTSPNATLEREHILKEVWGDEGDYVGRTLDVYVSKLRKKLETDASLKIENIRGVGYRLLVNRN